VDLHIPTDSMQTNIPALKKQKNETSAIVRLMAIFCCSMLQA